LAQGPGHPILAAKFELLSPKRSNTALEWHFAEAAIARINSRGDRTMRKAALAISLAGFFIVSSHAADTGRRYVEAPKVGANPALPFSNGVMVGETFYVAGHIGIDTATGQAAANVDDEARLVMDSVQHTLEQAGLKTDDLVSVTVYCTDLELYDKFNAVYRTYFHGHFPARAFIGINKLVRGAHFEVAGVAVNPAGIRKL
jgi:2-iminobutanoate/2-iminopropanoate deaminase